MKDLFSKITYRFEIIRFHFFRFKWEYFDKVKPFRSRIFWQRVKTYPITLLFIYLFFSHLDYVMYKQTHILTGTWGWLGLEMPIFLLPWEWSLYEEVWRVKVFHHWITWIVVYHVYFVISLYFVQIYRYVQRNWTKFCLAWFLFSIFSSELMEWFWNNYFNYLHDPYNWGVFLIFGTITYIGGHALDFFVEEEEEEDDQEDEDQLMDEFYVTNNVRKDITDEDRERDWYKKELGEQVASQWNWYNDKFNAWDDKDPGSGMFDYDDDENSSSMEEFRDVFREFDADDPDSDYDDEQDLTQFSYRYIDFMRKHNPTRIPYWSLTDEDKERLRLAGIKHPDQIEEELEESWNAALEELEKKYNKEGGALLFISDISKNGKTLTEEELKERYFFYNLLYYMKRGRKMRDPYNNVTRFLNVRRFLRIFKVYIKISYRIYAFWHGLTYFNFFKRPLVVGPYSIYSPRFNSVKMFKNLYRILKPYIHYTYWNWIFWIWTIPIRIVIWFFFRIITNISKHFYLYYWRRRFYKYSEIWNILRKKNKIRRRNVRFFNSKWNKEETKELINKPINNGN